MNGLGWRGGGGASVVLCQIIKSARGIGIRVGNKVI